jgi:hypothetical protein
MSGVLFYFVLGEDKQENLDIIKEKSSYIINNTFMITTNFEKAKKEVDYQIDYYNNRNIFSKWFFYYPKHWRAIEVKSNLSEYEPKKNFYINKKTLNITQVKPSKEHENEFIKYKLESLCGTGLINGCDDLEKD